MIIENILKSQNSSLVAVNLNLAHLNCSVYKDVCEINQKSESETDKDQASQNKTTGGAQEQ